MEMDQTLLMIKPDAVEDRHVAVIITILERNRLLIRKMKLEHFTRERAEGFYAEHKKKPFFNDLIQFMTSGPVIQIVLECDDAVNFVREIIGVTDYRKAAKGTIRRLFARSCTQNAVHASDSPESAKREITYLFGPD
jgi:nucleoside-diphosphate kinase